MQIFNLLLSSFFFVLCLGVPVELFPRAANLEISLRETGKNTDHWHFGLVIHAPGDITAGGKKTSIHEHVISEGCLSYNMEERVTKASQLSATGTLLPANGETTDDALNNAVVKVLAGVPSSKIDPNGFNNCLDFAVEAVRRLNTARYVSSTDYAKFESVKTTLGAAVRAKTEAGTLAHCKRDPGGSCTTSKTSAKPIKGGKK